MKLVGSLTSPFVRKIRVQLQEKEIPYEFVLENVWDENTRISDHNPLGKVPCLCLLYTSDAADDSLRVDLGGRRIIKKKHVARARPRTPRSSPPRATHFFSSRRRHTR